MEVSLSTQTLELQRVCLHSERSLVIETLRNFKIKKDVVSGKPAQTYFCTTIGL